MKPLELAQTRYATKQYNPLGKISEDKIQELKEVLRLTPSSINIQPWQFIFVQDANVKEQLAKASLHNEEKIKQAKLLVVFSYADNLEAFNKVVENDLPEYTRKSYFNSTQNMTEATIKQWFSRQVYIALGFGLSTCVALDLDATPMEGIEPDKYIQILNLKDYRPICAMAVGIHDKNDYNHPSVRPKQRRKLEDVVISI